MRFNRRRKPRVSIGMPVFNGEKYIDEALDSILAQTYSDFELIISDNASTDQTRRICREYAADDNRIHYYRNEKNLGASKNFNRVFELSSGEYFKWAAYDDVLAPKYLSYCVSILDQNPSIVLCHSKTGCINNNSELVGTYDKRSRIDSSMPHERFGDLISFNHLIWDIFGLIRASALRMTPLMGNYIGSDRNLMAEIALIGRIYVIPEHLFFRRKNRCSGITYMRTKYSAIKFIVSLPIFIIIIQAIFLQFNLVDYIIPWPGGFLRGVLIRPTTPGLQSNPWDWLINQKPRRCFLFLFSATKEVYPAGPLFEEGYLIAYWISMNWAILSLTIPSMIYLVYCLLKKKEVFARYILTWWTTVLSLYICVRIFTLRIMYIHYALLLIVPVCASIAYMLQTVPLKSSERKLVITLYLIIVIILFFSMYPVK